MDAEPFQLSTLGSCLLGLVPLVRDAGEALREGVRLKGERSELVAEGRLGGVGVDEEVGDGGAGEVVAAFVVGVEEGEAGDEVTGDAGAGRTGHADRLRAVLSTLATSARWAIT